MIGPTAAHPSPLNEYPFGQQLRCTLLGLKTIVDFIPNHTSNQTEWFAASAAADPDDPYYDYYVWREQPNQWV